MIKRRISDRDFKRPTQVGLYDRGILVATLNLAWTDPRFVKGDDLLPIALEAALTRPSRRIDDSNLDVVWDRLQFHWGFFVYACDRQGNRIWNPA